MAINQVQFQRGLPMAEFMKRYGMQGQCHAALVASRWPSGFVCPDCGCSRHCTFMREGLRYWQCSACREQTTVTCGTVFQATKLPLTSWFLAMHLLTQAKNNVSALELKRHLGVRYKAAWLMKHKLLQVMYLREDTRRLDGRVEVDDAYLGGRLPGARAGAAPRTRSPSSLRCKPMMPVTRCWPACKSWSSPRRPSPSGHASRCAPRPRWSPTDCGTSRLSPPSVQPTNARSPAARPASSWRSSERSIRCLAT